jgi:hypothetical protein
MTQPPSAPQCMGHVPRLTAPGQTRPLTLTDCADLLLRCVSRGTEGAAAVAGSIPALAATAATATPAWGGHW